MPDHATGSSREINQRKDIFPPSPCFLATGPAGWQDHISGSTSFLNPLVDAKIRLKVHIRLFLFCWSCGIDIGLKKFDFFGASRRDSRRQYNGGKKSSFIFILPIPKKRESAPSINRILPFHPFFGKEGNFLLFLPDVFDVARRVRDGRSRNQGDVIRSVHQACLI